MTHPSDRIPIPIDSSPEGDEEQATPELPEAWSEEVGTQLALTQEHLRGLHLEPREGCWRCNAAALRLPAQR